ncbi:MAG: tyrosine--tRNA ligase [Parcubacteria group bacterium]|nr:tyrosine--tRNA ligase [Parcubacteria group bacterium]
MNIKEKLELISRNTEEVLTKEDLENLLLSKSTPRHYIGFEISGKIHLGTGLVALSKVKDFADAGLECVIFLADWHTWINDKLGGDFAAIKEIAVNYFKEGIKTSFKILGGDPKKLHFILGSDLYHRNDKYLGLILGIAKHSTLARIKRSITILGRKEGSEVDFAKLIYPVMQVADIFALKADIAHAGLDQRKAHVIARAVAPKIGYLEPVVIHHSLLMGLTAPAKWPITDLEKKELKLELKMSKSKPDSAIFIHDSEEEIKRKIKKSFCPEKEIAYNPILDMVEKIIFRLNRRDFEIKRLAKFGGNIVYNSFSDLQNDYKTGRLHPEDLKIAVSLRLIQILKPAIDHFKKTEPAKMLARLEELMEK